VFQRFFGVRLFVLMVAVVPFLQARDVWVEAKAGYCFVTNDVTEDIYGRGSGVYGAELTGRLWCEGNWYGWMSADYFTKKGHVEDPVAGNYQTKMTLVPLGFGLKYSQSWGCWDCWSGNWYLGAGVLAAYVKEHVHSPYVIPERSKWGAGGIVKGGCLIDLSCCVFLDLWLDYSFIKMHFHDSTIPPVVQGRKANVSGCGIGAGLGYRF